MEDDMKIATRRFVRPEFMNHHQTLYAGYISEWLTEAAMIGIRDFGKRLSNSGKLFYRKCSLCDSG